MPEKKDIPLNVLFGASEWEIITTLADSLGISKGAAVRLLVRRGGHETRHPSPPKETPKS